MYQRPTCHELGPNQLVYGSIIINCFLIYTIYRVIVTRVASHLMSWRSESLDYLSSQITPAATATGEGNQSIEGGDTPVAAAAVVGAVGWKEHAGNVTFLLNHNRASLPTAVAAFALWAIISIVTFIYLGHVKVGRNRIDCDEEIVCNLACLYCFHCSPTH